MLSVKRQQLIKDILLEKKSVSVSELSEMYGVSFETIRRDLKVLESEGFAEKTYGGAILRERVGLAADFKTLSHVMVDIKQKIAAIATHFIEPGDCIFIDFSTTCAQIVSLLQDIPLNVLTNSLEVINQLQEKQNISLISTGGNWDAENYSFMGRAAVHNLKRYHLDKAFVSCRALSMEHGLSDRTESESELRKTIIENANKVYLLADASKFDKAAFVKTCDFQNITAIITDKTLDEEWKEFLTQHNVSFYDASFVEADFWTDEEWESS